MEFKEFVKKYYSYAMKRLGELNAFNAVIIPLVNVMLPDLMGEYSSYLKELDTPILDAFSYELKEDAPYEAYSKFMSAMAYYYPDLSIILMDLEGLTRLYESKKFYKSHIDNAIDVLKKMGILE